MSVCPGPRQDLCFHCQLRVHLRHSPRLAQAAASSQILLTALVLQGSDVPFKRQLRDPFGTSLDGLSAASIRRLSGPRGCKSLALASSQHVSDAVAGRLRPGRAS